MANNQYVNKVMFGDNLILDLTQDTVDANHLARGYTAHSMSGEFIIGALDIPTITLNISSLPTKTTYKTAQPLDLTGLEIIATTVDGYTKNITNDCVYSPANGTPITDQDTGVTITYTYYGITYNTQFPITVLTIVTWADGTDEQIVNMINSHYAGEIDLTDYWNVGDVRKVNLSSVPGIKSTEYHYAKTNKNLVLMNAGGKELTTPINGHTECAFVVGFDAYLGWYEERGVMNSTATNAGGWNATERRTWCNEVFPDSFSSSIKGIFKQYKNVTGIGGSQNETAVSDDYFAFPSGIEIWGSSASSVICDAEIAATTQFSYFNSSSTRKTYSDCWTRTARSNNSGQFLVTDSNGNLNFQAANNAQAGFAPIGVI